MWLFENILNETGEFHPTLARFVDGLEVDDILELAKDIPGCHPPLHTRESQAGGSHQSQAPP